MRIDPTASLELTEVAASAGPLAHRADALLGALRRVIPFDGAWLALASPHRNTYTSLASADLDDSTLDYLSGPVMAHDIEVTGANHPGPPLSLSDLPYPREELRTWAECLIPAGYSEALAVGLFGPGRRHVGFLALLSGGREPPPLEARHLLGRLTPALANAIDPMRSLLAAARLVHGATGGVAVHQDGATEVLPGLQRHALLAADSAVLLAARAEINRGHVYTSFLWPLGGPHAPSGHARVTAMAAGDVPAPLTGVVLISPPGDLHGLTPRELEVLGLLINGCSNREISRALVVAQRTVAAHLEHILAKLAAPTRTLAAVRAQREGLYVPRPCRAPAGIPS
jgi:DNA-binding CsgD family transcriptional regulator